MAHLRDYSKVTWVSAGMAHIMSDAGPAEILTLPWTQSLHLPQGEGQPTGGLGLLACPTFESRPEKRLWMPWHQVAILCRRTKSVQGAACWPCLPSLSCPLPDDVQLLLCLNFYVSLLIALGCLLHSMTLTADMTFREARRLLHMQRPSSSLAGRAGLHGGAGG